LSSLSGSQLLSASQNQAELIGQESSSRLASSRGYSISTISSEETVPLLNQSINSGVDESGKLTIQLKDQKHPIQSIHYHNQPALLSSSSADEPPFFNPEEDVTSGENLRSRKSRISCPYCEQSYSVNKDGSPNKFYSAHIERAHYDKTQNLQKMKSL